MLIRDLVEATANIRRGAIGVNYLYGCFATIGGKLLRGWRSECLEDCWPRASLRSEARLSDADLGRRYIARRQPLRALNDCKLHSLALIQSLVSVGLYRRVVNENVFAAIAHYESVPLCCIEPFYRTDLSQCFSLLFPDY